MVLFIRTGSHVRCIGVSNSKEICMRSYLQDRTEALDFQWNIRPGQRNRDRVDLAVCVSVWTWQTKDRAKKTHPL